MFGEVAIAGRRGFERRYALAEQVIPADVLRAVRAARGRDPRARAAGRALVRRRLGLRSGRLLPHPRPARGDDRDRRTGRRGRAAAGPRRAAGTEGARPLPAWMHTDAAVPRAVDAAAILTPFDPVVWFRDRAERTVRLPLPHRDLHARPAARVRLLLAAGARRRRRRRQGRSEGRPRDVHPARAVGVVGARARRTEPQSGSPGSCAPRAAWQGLESDVDLRAGAMPSTTSRASCPTRAATSG